MSWWIYGGDNFASKHGFTPMFRRMQTPSNPTIRGASHYRAQHAQIRTEHAGASLCFTHTEITRPYTKLMALAWIHEYNTIHTTYVCMYACMYMYMHTHTYTHKQHRHTRIGVQTSGDSQILLRFECTTHSPEKLVHVPGSKRGRAHIGSRFSAPRMSDREME